MLTYYHIPLIKSYGKQRTAMHKISRGLILWSPAESNFPSSVRYVSVRQSSLLLRTPPPFGERGNFSLRESYLCTLSPFSIKFPSCTRSVNAQQ